MPELSLSLIVVLLLVLGAEFVNGWTDAPNAIATVVSTKVLSPRQAVILAVLLNILGAMSGQAVAATIGKGFVEADIINLTTVAAAMIALIGWSSIAAYFGLPTSESHALVAGLTGAGFASGGLEALLSTGWKKVFMGLGFSTFLGFIFGYLIILIISWIFRNIAPGKVKKIFGRLQILSAAFMAFGHGSNDGQKFIGAFALALVLGGVMPEFHIPIWVIILCATVMGIGTSVGGWRIIRTMGVKLVKLETYHGFAAETGAATAIQIASVLGIPLSTTHTINTSIMGVGSARRFSAVRWGVAGQIIAAWVLTFPVCGVLSWGITKVLMLFA
ncbi:MAG: inorganic phosphate transporter [Deltaproteobacteria bacterium]|nr:inorganic phosphate transporter [Deltaproteobacteria bacterium]